MLIIFQQACTARRGINSIDKKLTLLLMVYIDVGFHLFVGVDCSEDTNDGFVSIFGRYGMHDDLFLCNDTD